MDGHRRLRRSGTGNGNIQSIFGKRERYRRQINSRFQAVSRLIVAKERRTGIAGVTKVDRADGITGVIVEARLEGSGKGALEQGTVLSMRVSQSSRGTRNEAATAAKE